MLYQFLSTPIFYMLIYMLIGLICAPVIRWLNKDQTFGDGWYDIHSNKRVTSWNGWDTIKSVFAWIIILYDFAVESIALSFKKMEEKGKKK